MFQRMKKNLAAVLTLAVLAAALLPVSALAQEPVSVTIPVEVKVSGSSIPADTEYRLVIEGLNNAPMPESAGITIKDGGTASFGPVQYTVPDDYQYRIYQNSDKKDRFTYDETVYAVTVQVVNDGNGGLAANVIAETEGTSEKAAGIVFANTYTPSGGDGGSSGGGGGSSSGGGGSSGGRSDLTTTDTVTISDPGTPLSEITEEEVPLTDGGIIDQILDTLVPLATLPRTGDYSLSYGILLILLLASGGMAGVVYRRRKKSEAPSE